MPKEQRDDMRYRLFFAYLIIRESFWMKHLPYNGKRTVVLAGCAAVGRKIGREEQMEELLGKVKELSGKVEGLSGQMKELSKKIEEALEKKKDLSEKIYQKWQTEWSGNNLADGATEQKGKSACPKDDDYFFEQFTQTYGFIKKKIKTNRKANFRCKTVFLLAYSLPPVICFLYQMKCLLVITEHGYELSGKFSLFPLIVSFLMACFFASIVAKWIDIKKYQETWSRHQDHKYKLDREMLKFVSNQGAYSSQDRKDVFIENVWNIWDANQEMFARNMNDRETGLYNILHMLFRK